MAKECYEAVAEKVRAALSEHRLNKDIAKSDPWKDQIEVYAMEMGRESGVFMLAYGLAEVFGADNPRFDREQFLTACGLRST